MGESLVCGFKQMKRRGKAGIYLEKSETIPFHHLIEAFQFTPYLHALASPQLSQRHIKSV